MSIGWANEEKRRKERKLKEQQIFKASVVPNVIKHLWKSPLSVMSSLVGGKRCCRTSWGQGGLTLTLFAFSLPSFLTDYRHTPLCSVSVRFLLLSGFNTKKITIKFTN